MERSCAITCPSIDRNWRLLLMRHLTISFCGALLFLIHSVSPAYCVSLSPDTVQPATLGPTSLNSVALLLCFVFTMHLTMKLSVWVFNGSIKGPIVGPYAEKQSASAVWFGSDGVQAGAGASLCIQTQITPFNSPGVGTGARELDCHYSPIWTGALELLLEQCLPTSNTKRNCEIQFIKQPLEKSAPEPMWYSSNKTDNPSTELAGKLVLLFSWKFCWPSEAERQINASSLVVTGDVAGSNPQVDSEAPLMSHKWPQPQVSSLSAVSGLICSNAPFQTMPTRRSTSWWRPGFARCSRQRRSTPCWTSEYQTRNRPQVEQHGLWWPW